MNMNQIKNKFLHLIYYSRKKRIRFLSVVFAVIFFFNLFSTRILPSRVFLSAAANINVNELVSLANSERQSRGISQLTVDSRLIQAAKAKGEDMIEKDYWSHYGPNGESPWKFILASGYDYIYGGENLAKDFFSAAPIHSAWMSSPSHKSNILNSNFTNVGIAAVTGNFQGKETTIVVQMFGSEEYQPSTGEVASEEITSDLPQTGPETQSEASKELESPEIKSPANGDILNDGAFSIRGKAAEGKQVELFNFEEVLGTVEINGENFSYRQDDFFRDGDYLFKAKSKDEGGNESKFSNEVSITVDTIKPNILKDSFKLLYAELGEEGTNYVFEVRIEDNPYQVKMTHDDKSTKFARVGNNWQGMISDIAGEDSPFVLSAIDKAGNKSQVSFSASEIDRIIGAESQEVENDELEQKNWFIENIVRRLFSRSLRGNVNLIIVLMMIGLLVAELIIVERSGKTVKGNTSLWFIPVFVIILFVGLVGSGGEVL